MEPSPGEMSSRSPSFASWATDGPGRSGVLSAVFLLSAAALADEIVLIRLLSFRFWPHFVPMIVSQAMLGFGCAGVALHLFRGRVARRPASSFAWMVLAAGPSFDLAFRASLAVSFDPFLLLWEPSAWPAFGLFFVLLALPFFLTGGAIAVPFAFPLGRPGPVYAAAFAGSAAGSVLALPAFSLMPTESLMRLPLGLGVAAAVFVVRGFGGRLRRWRKAACAAALLLLFLPAPVLRISPYKDLAIAERLPAARLLAVRAGPSGDYRALFAPGIHSAPGLSLRFEGAIPPQASLYLDGEFLGVVPEGGGTHPPRYLGFFPSALAYRLAEHPAVAQFGLRGTEGILAAAGSGAAAITVVEPAKELVALVGADLSGFSGGPPEGLRLEIVEEGARNFLAREGTRFDLIDVAGISSTTFASLGVHAAGETFLLTREGIRSALSRLSDGGTLAISGWLKSPPRESIKILATVRKEMEREGPPSASERILMVRGWGSFSILVKRFPFTAEERAKAIRFCKDTGFSMVWPPAPDGGADDGVEEGALRAAVGRALAAPPETPEKGFFDLSPATDDSPYFHRFLRLSSVPAYRRLLGSQWVPFLEWGVVFLLLSLAASVGIAALGLLLPLALVRLPAVAGGISFAAYFSALGLAYMLVELTFLKIGILLLGAPVRAAAVAIGGFAFFSGIGSAISGRWESAATMRRRIFPAIAFLAPAGLLLLFFSKAALLPMGEIPRIAVFLASLAPAALLMGVPFPAALSRLAGAAESAVPFAWGINGFFSVAGATLASVGAIWIGFRVTVAIGALLYLAAGALFHRVGESAER